MGKIKLQTVLLFVVIHVSTSSSLGSLSEKCHFLDSAPPLRAVRFPQSRSRAQNRETGQLKQNLSSKWNVVHPTVLWLKFWGKHFCMVSNQETTLMSRHKHSHPPTPPPPPKQFQHVETAAREDGKNKPNQLWNALLTHKYKAEQLLCHCCASGDVLCCTFCQHSFNWKGAHTPGQSYKRGNSVLDTLSDGQIRAKGLKRNFDELKRKEWNLGIS